MSTFYLSLLFTGVVLIPIYKRAKEKNNQVSIVGLLIPCSVIFFLSLSFFSIGNLVISTVEAILFENKYDAVVVAHESTSIDNDNSAYTAIVEFRDEKGNYWRKPLSYGTSHPVEIGKKIKISYKNGAKDVINLTLSEQKLPAFILTIIFLGLCLVMVGIVFFALGKDLSFLFNIGLSVLIYVIFPGAMLFFLGIMSWILWEYFQGKRQDTPIWVLGMFSLFVTMLIPAFLGYMKMLFDKDSVSDDSRKTNRLRKRISQFNKRIPK